MTEIRMDWETMTLTGDGHAGGGPNGQDPICAGVSALMMALLNQVNDEADMNALYKHNEQAGRILIHVEPRNHAARRRARHYFRVIMTGLQGWERAYPDNITTQEVNGDGTD